MTAALRLQAADIEAIERATLQAVAPQWVEALEAEHWLLPMDPGTVGRARSAVPLRHEAPRDPAGLLDRIAERYEARGLPMQLRVADAACFDGMAEAMAARGLAGARPTHTQVGSLRTMRSVSQGEPAEVSAAPDGGWTGVFLGPGFDPVDGACRVQALTRASGNLFASVRDENGATLAAGAVSLGHGWAGVHGMRTEQSARGRGLAGRVLAGLAQAALARGYERVFLQVEAGNEAALALYRRAGFQPAWTYRYWQPRAPR